MANGRYASHDPYTAANKDFPWRRWWRRRRWRSYAQADADTHGSTHGDAGTYGSTHGDAGTYGSTHADGPGDGPGGAPGGAGR